MRAVVRGERAFVRRAYRSGVRVCILTTVLACGGDTPPSPTQPPVIPRILWTGGTGATIYSTPGFDGSQAYFRGIHNELYAVNKNDGHRAWTVTLPAPGDGSAGRQVLVVNGVVAVAASDVFGVAPGSGQIIWQFHPSVGRQPGAFGMATSGSTLFTGSFSGHVFAIDAATGSQKWTVQVVPADTVSVYTPVYKDGVVYVCFTEFGGTSSSTRGGVAALDALTGTTRWLQWLPHLRSPSASTATLGLALAGGVVIADSREGPVYAYDAASGNYLWTIPTSDPGPYFGNTPILQDQRPLASDGVTFFVGSTSGYVTAYTTSGQQVWRSIAMRGSPIAMSADSKYVYAVHASGQLVAFDIASGQFAWAVEDNNGLGLFLVAPAMDGSHLYLGGANNSYAVNAN